MGTKTQPNNVIVKIAFGKKIYLEIALKISLKVTLKLRVKITLKIKQTNCLFKK